MARPYLRRLREDLGETVHLGVMEGLAVFYVDKLVSANSIQLVSEVGQTMPLHTTSLGKAILAALPGGRAGSDLHQDGLRPADGPDHPHRGRQFREEIARTQARGYADRRPRERGLRRLRRRRDHRPGRPAGRRDQRLGPGLPHPRPLRRFGPEVVATVAAIGRELGAEAPAPALTWHPAARREREPASGTKGAAR